jgi:hypothetical protein
MEKPPSDAHENQKKGRVCFGGSAAHLRTEPQLRSDELWFFGFGCQRNATVAMVQSHGGEVEQGGQHGLTIAARCSLPIGFESVHQYGAEAHCF